jgi:hypothetical protein
MTTFEPLEPVGIEIDGLSPARGLLRGLLLLALFGADVAVIVAAALGLAL